MKKHLTAKVQPINPKIEGVTTNIAKGITIEADNELDFEKKGTIHALYDISTAKELDVRLVDKIVYDVLHDTYFQSENVSPVQAVEKAILKLRDNIIKVASNDGKNSNVVFNISTTILWGNTLYIVQYGNSKVNLMRGADVKPITTSSEGNFSVASGVVKDNDVVIMTTEDFARKFPAKNLVSLSEVRANALDALQAAMILQFKVSKAFTKNEVLDFGSKFSDEDKNDANSQAPKTIVRKTHQEKLKDNQEKRKKLQVLFKAFVISISLVAAIAILYSLAINFFFTEEVVEEESQRAESVVLDSPITPENNERAENILQAEKVDPEVDAQYNIVRIEPVIFYDLSVVEEQITPSELFVIGNQIYVSDNLTGKVYSSALEETEFSANTITFENINNMILYNQNLGFVDEEGFKVIDVNTEAISETYLDLDLNITQQYLGNLYTVRDNSIIKYSIADGSSEPETWIESDLLENPTSIAIDSSIYVAAGNDIFKFTAGEKDEFKVAELNVELGNNLKIITNEDVLFVYILDPSNKRVLITNKVGEVQNQVKLKDSTVWNNLTDFALDAENNRLMLLNGTKIFEIDLSEL